jgi:hypothetical protein
MGFDFPSTGSGQVAQLSILGSVWVERSRNPHGEATVRPSLQPTQDARQKGENPYPQTAERVFAQCKTLRLSHQWFCES